ncbi:phosphonate transport system ATP-binding protein [Desulfocicer vacuolatum DSM 3385]|uniref:Phosphonate transport system ATP-binding protein n=1 Tax=Desulfocicer vacuolatum DSM 3385 TaxID=1121400 RepID=A0A1W2ERC4_9BACT|nr:phosphonate ABC transporter ATP-binding protein [Desulfocicer vacuolatum]SMD12254.1 phosphonate transport system ATP-binding protein [Desulfocicer vacuolatum DSM 3385]
MGVRNINSLRQNTSDIVSAIITDKLSMVYPNGTKAVDNVSLDIKNGDFISIIGSSGAGKSSFLRIFNRLIKPTSGTVTLLGEDITSVNGRKKTGVRRKVGMIFQQFHLVRRLSVIQNVLVGRLRFNSTPCSKTKSLCSIFNNEDKEFAFDCLKQVGIAHLAFHRADTLSGGQQQRVAIARTLAQEPEIFLADEPIASLDPHSAEVVMDILLKIHETRNIPVLVNIHHIDFARRYGKRILGMKQGGIVFDGTSTDLTEDEVTNIYGAKINEAFGEECLMVANYV